MADIKLTQVKSGGGSIPLGSTIMSVRDEDDFTEEGKRYLQAGTILTGVDLSGLDTSLVKNGVYLSNDEGRVDLPANWVSSSHNYFISGNTHVYSSGSDVYRSADAGMTWSGAITANTTTIQKEGIATDGAGNWVSCSDQYIWSSEDDGASWTLRQNTGNTRDMKVYWCRENQRFYGVKIGGSTGAGDSVIWRSAVNDGTSWSQTTQGGNGDNFAILMSFPPAGRTELFGRFRATTGLYYIMKSTDGGDTWTSWIYNQNVFTGATPVALWQRDGFLWVVWSDTPNNDEFTISRHDVTLASGETIQEARVYNSLTDHDGGVPQPTHVPFLSYTEQEYHVGNGYKILKDGFTIVPTFAASDGVPPTYSTVNVGRDFIARLQGTDTTTNKPPLTDEACIGTTIPYSEGAAKQYVRID